MNQPDWNGVYPALTTAFHADGSLDTVGFARKCQIQVKAGVHGLIIGGSLGESSTLNHDERIELLRTASAAVGGKVPVLMNVAEGSTRNAVSLAEQAQENGADGLMLLPPMMYRSTDAETTLFFSDVAGSTDLPILIYNNPVDYKTEVKPEMFDVLLAKHANIQAVKESTRDVSNVTRLINRFGERLKILCGVDTIALECLVAGAHGWVAGLVCAFPRETVAIYEHVLGGRLDEALALHRWFLPILELDIHPQLVQNIKLAEGLTGLGNEYVRLPRKPLEGTERERVEAIVRNGLETAPLGEWQIDI